MPVDLVSIFTSPLFTSYLCETKNSPVYGRVLDWSGGQVATKFFRGYEWTFPSSLSLTPQLGSAARSQNCATERRIIDDPNVKSIMETKNGGFMLFRWMVTELRENYASRQLYAVIIRTLHQILVRQKERIGN